MNKEPIQDQEGNDSHKYIIFPIGSELYATHLLDVREVVEKLPIKKVPNTIRSFLGVCNLRGQIIGVLDLAERFEIKTEALEQSVFLVFEAGSGSIAALVDGIQSVVLIPPDEIETELNLIAMIDQKFIKGVGKLKDRLVTIIDLKSILSQEELVKIEHSKMERKPSSSVKEHHT